MYTDIHYQPTLQDAYLRPASRRSNNSGEPLAGGAASLGRNSSNSSGRGAGAAAAGGATATGLHGDDLDDDGYRPGQPIGLLAAIGETPKTASFLRSSMLMAGLTPAQAHLWPRNLSGGPRNVTSCVPF